MDYYRWALKPICIVSNFKSLIAFPVQKLLGCGAALRLVLPVLVKRAEKHIECKQQVMYLP